ncbi:hypothetical protein [Bradyrhizobium sp. CW1]|uniref:hypothetical protein n=1 Tax=Bradyrhizobium sp. CW1 TaxID=2782686 RepID=UPI001FFFC975|nr:hypothetical protein [Bradyrhizobium sp. CW1]UPJ26798.1 hypothetical protein IVB54_34960 [Bradyrhizobium sp. CW1]
MLFQPERNRILDAATVTSRIDAILNELDVEAFADNGRYVLALRLGQTSRLSATLNAASGDAFDTDDADRQMDFIRADLETGASPARTARGDLLLMTENLVYDLQPLRAAGVDESWNVASCDNARHRDRVTLGRRENIELPSHRIEIIRFGHDRFSFSASVSALKAKRSILSGAGRPRSTANHAAVRLPLLANFQGRDEAADGPVLVINMQR